MRYSLILCLFISISSMLSGEVKSADASGKQDSLGFRRYTLEKIRVIADKPEETIGSISIIYLDNGPEKLAGNIKDVLQNSAGLSITTGTKDESNLKIRGFRKNEVKILIDGRPLNAGYFGNIDLQNLPLSEISEIHVLKGPVSALYGGNTLGGVINLITKEPSRRHWMKAGLMAKRNNTNQLELSVAHNFEDWNFWVYASREHTDGMVLPKSFSPTLSENGDVRNNDKKTQNNFQTKGSFTLFDFHTLGFTAGLTTIGKKLIPASIYESNDYRLYKNWKRYQATLMGDFQVGQDIKVSSMAFLDGGGDTYQQYNDPQYEHLSVDSDMQSQTLGLNLKMEWQMSKNLTLNSGYNFDSQTSTRKDNGDYPNWTPHRIYFQQLYLQAKQNFSEKLKFTCSAGASLASGDLRNKTVGFVEPALGIYYRLPGRTVISIASGINTSYPTMRQLFSAERGNPNLLPQTGIKTELSLVQPFVVSDLSGSIDLCAYQNKVRNLIDIIDDRYENIYKVNSYGYEIVLSVRPIYWLDVSSSYSYLDYSDVSDYTLTETPKHCADFKADMKLPFSIGFNYASLYKDTRQSQDAGSVLHTLPSYWSHSVFLNRKMGKIKVIFGIENVADTYYEEEYGFPAAGRNFGLKLEAEI